MKNFVFKGKSLKTGEWIFGSLANVKGFVDGYIISYNLETNKWGEWEEVDMNTVELIEEIL